MQQYGREQDDLSSAFALQMPTQLEMLSSLAQASGPTVRLSEIYKLRNFLDDQEIHTIVFSELTFNSPERDILTESETTRAKRVAQIIIHAFDTFGPQQTRQWLHHRFFNLGKQSAVELFQIRTEDGAEAVDRYLTQIDEGMFV